MFASVLVKFVGKVCNLLNLSLSLLFSRRLLLLGVSDKQLVHISYRSLYEKNLDVYVVFSHSWFPITLTTISFLFTDRTYKNVLISFFPVVFIAAHNITNRECESHAYPG